MKQEEANAQQHQPTPTNFSPNGGEVAIRRAELTSDYTVLAATFLVLFLLSTGYFLFDAFTNETSSSDPLENLFAGIFGGAILFVALLLLGMLIIRLQRQTALGNSLQVEYSSYDWLREWANKVAADFNMPPTEIFVTQNPILNAYAYGFVKPYNIVLHSGLFDKLTHDELRVVIVHEMAHIKYKHTLALMFLQPFLSIPVVGIFTSWIIGFWSRRSELTADRLALAYLGDSEKVKTTLIKIHAGAEVSKYMNETARQWLQYNAERPMNRFAQTFSSHPFLVRRLHQIDRWNAYFYPHVPESPKPVAPADQPAN